MEELKSGKHGHRAEDHQPIREILARLGDKWTVATLSVLGNKRMRFKDLYRGIGGISQRMLVVTLRHLERDGLLARTAYPTVPPRVEYELSDRGRSLREVLEPVEAWAFANYHAIEESRRRFDVETRKPEGIVPIKW